VLQACRSAGCKIKEMMKRTHARSIYATGGAAIIWVGSAVIGINIGPRSGAIFATCTLAVALVIEWMIFRARPPQRGSPIEPKRTRTERMIEEPSGGARLCDSK
jgi:hypothetical protein